jgi:hypothetical protein
LRKKKKNIIAKEKKEANPEFPVKKKNKYKKKYKRNPTIPNTTPEIDQAKLNRDCGPGLVRWTALPISLPSHS